MGDSAQQLMVIKGACTFGQRLSPLSRSNRFSDARCSPSRILTPTDCAQARNKRRQVFLQAVPEEAVKGPNE